jgi:hypothetical protein
MQTIFDSVCREVGDRELALAALTQPIPELLYLIYVLSLNKRDNLIETFSYEELRMRDKSLCSLQRGIKILIKSGWFFTPLLDKNLFRYAIQLFHVAGHAENECCFAQVKIETDRIIRKQRLYALSVQSLPASSSIGKKFPIAA